MEHTLQLLTALGAFKDWSNYLLVTTVAALGWSATSVKIKSDLARAAIVASFTLSIVFGIATLGLIPLVAEQLGSNSRSIYEVAGEFRPAWMWGPTVAIRLKWLCFPQHIFFLAGIVTFGIAAARKRITPG